MELVVQLERWDPPLRRASDDRSGDPSGRKPEAGREYDRLGLEDARYDVMGVQIPMIRMPVAPGRNIAILVEVAARNQLLRTRGSHAAQALVDRLTRDLEAAVDLDRGEDQ